MHLTPQERDKLLIFVAAELARASTMPRMQRRLLAPRFAPVTAALLGLQMQRASIPALVRVVTSDRWLADRAHAAGATVEGAETFRSRLESS